MQIHPLYNNIYKTDIDREPNPTWARFFLGKPIATSDAAHQAIGKVVGLAVFSSDALSSVAYGPQELMTILMLAGTAALHLTLPLVTWHRHPCLPSLLFHTSRPSMPTRVVVVLTLWPATTWASCRRKLPVRHC